MTAIAVAGRPQDPSFAALTQKIVQLVLASASRASVVARGVPNARLPQDRKSLEYAFASLFDGTNGRARQLRRAFGRPAGRFTVPPGIDFGDVRSVIDQAITGQALDAARIPPATFSNWQTGRSRQEVAELIARILKFRRLPVLGGGTGAPPPVRQARELQLKLARVHCVERVGWEATDWDGKDAILCGGLGFDSTLESPPAAGSPSTAHFRKVPQFKAGIFSADGVTHNFSPDKTFCKWDLSSPGEWPRGFIGIIAFAEKDSGDEFPQLIEDIWGLLSPAVIAAVSALVTAAVGAGVGRHRH
ncbi:hypothetical protein [Actinoplanes xinjiangensis]|uniref:Uncharacterized protein n=1 Tax=Actinoplanes xinjiangensis TaxID=512350 RepID=A0A316E7V5_9ACTN|nr:hypothetical protein [Actinoplanes xinjiangensis]PWK26451.1 hypothetical protein BC793_16416 [Actinoplanes xinjiangensis]GIF45249.1 hypothetical protein Axi01nite_95600 [Actinoplanes xinjiangensis]